MVGTTVKIVKVSRVWVKNCKSHSEEGRPTFYSPAGFGLENKNKIEIALTQKIKKNLKIALNKNN